MTDTTTNGAARQAPKDAVDFRVITERGETVVEIVDRETRYVLATMRGPEVMDALRLIMAQHFDSYAVKSVLSEG